ncbi:MAG: C39 family peptidase [Methanosarcinaceae archaeon]
MKSNIKFGISALLAAMLLMSMVFVPTVSAKNNKITITNTDKQIILNLDKDCGVLVIPFGNLKCDSIYTDYTDSKPAIPDVRKTAITQLSGTIDDNNFISLSGTITLDGKPRNVKLTGQAEKVFVGWDVPEDAKPIYNEIDNRTMTRYEGARRMYASFVELKDGKGKFNLHGEFFEDGVGGLVGTAIINGKECNIGFVGESTSMSENVSIGIQTLSSSETLDVPQRSQWEIYWYEQNYDAASQACGETCAAMLEEYWSGNHPAIWDIWKSNGYESMNSIEAQTYLDGKGIYLNRGVKTGSLSYTISEIEEMIDDGKPFFLIEESRWGTCHAVVLRGYYDALISPYFILNDPNTLTGTNTMHWYNSDNTFFNYEENVYEYESGSSTGYSYLG